jgi:predicted ribosomally synthesized peptide with SipW-like signal peptide
MKTVKRSKVYLLVVALVLVLSLTVGLTMAYFSDYTEAKGGIKVALGGETTIHEDQNDDNKVIRIENTGDTDVVVRVAVYAPTEVSYTGSGWTEGDNGYWYYDKVLPVGEMSDPLTAKWEVPADLGDDYNVIVIQESDQVVYDASGNIVKPATDPVWDLVPSAY